MLHLLENYESAIQQQDLCHIYYGLFDGRPGVFLEDLTTPDGIECYQRKQNFAVNRLNEVLSRDDVEEFNYGDLTLPFILRFLFETDAITVQNVRHIIIPRMTRKDLPLEIRMNYTAVLMDMFGKQGQSLKSILTVSSWRKI